jgi:uncharacterized circularly permuted ATP-grasp superfamily protein/uncharacterized alpha-E superfamily protein
MSSSIEEQEISAPESLLSGYAPPLGVYDELIDSSGRLRDAWRLFAAGLVAMGQSGISQRFEQARRLLRENGLLPSLPGAVHGADRHWELDPLPLLISKSEWDPLAAGIEQRAHVLDWLLADIYGPQTLLRAGVVPPELIFGQRGFLPACHGFPLPHNFFLHLYAADLVRDAQGQWTVLADSTQSPVGPGFALENRLVISRTLPNDFHSLHVQRLAGSFITLRETLQALAPQRAENPRVVLLSPGPRSSSYFEDTYLARYLGYTLVEGGDLSVRGTSVFLKTLGGLLPVDVIFRRMADEDCDPLELLYDSLHGVAGLVQAARSGQVAIANGLGSGVLEAPALMAYLPEICRRLLGEELRLPSAPTWWCGRDSDWQYVQAHFDELIIGPAVSPRGQAVVTVSTLDQRQRNELLEAVRRNRSAYAAQAVVSRSTAPVWNNGALQPWHIRLRTFGVVSPGGKFDILPGGLARATPSSAAAGPGPNLRNKDVWVLSDRPVATVTLLRPQAAAVELRRSSNDLPSRVADNLFWFGRHLERAEGLVRHLRTVVVRITSELEPGGLPELAVLVRALSEQSANKPVPPADLSDNLAALEAETMRAFYHESKPGTLDDILRAMYETASLVRDRISVDTWRIVNQLDLDLLSPRPRAALRLGESLLTLNQVFNLLSALSGLTTESMTRGPGWRFVDMGRRLERALNILRLLRKSLVHPQAETISLLEAILEIADSAMTYRYRYLTSLQLAPLLDLLLTDETNPRSVGYQLAALSDHVRQLPGKEENPLHNRETRIMIAAQAELRLVDVEALARPKEEGLRSALDNFLADIILQLWQLSDSITHTYLTHTGPSQQLGSIGLSGATSIAARASGAASAGTGGQA